jgi:glucan 1,3-beta-glucosidase
MQQAPWRGVNLGGWLILEKWMTPSLFAGSNAIDEYGLCSELGDKAKSLLARHRKTFITEADFRWLKAHGINTVRLPVGYWILGDAAPYVGGIEYVDKAFAWAAKHRIGIVLDLHGAPGSQNGKDHSGRVGTVEWRNKANIAYSLDVLEALAKRYKKVPALVAIELLNEPSWRLGKRRLTNYYKEAHGRIRKHCSKKVAIIFPDAFKPKRWRRTLRGKKYQNVMLDTHLYQVFGWRNRHRHLLSHIRVAMSRRRLLAKLQRVRPVIVGEWSAALPRKAYDGMPHSEVQRTYAATQMAAMQPAAGWFYWSYKTESAGPWNYRDCVERGILPSSIE